MVAVPSSQYAPAARANRYLATAAGTLYAANCFPRATDRMDRATDISTWADYRARKRLLLVVVLLGLVVVLMGASTYLIERHGRVGLVWPLVAWAAAVVYAGIRLQDFRCPRCQRRFFHRSPPLLALRGRQCVNCSLPKE